jgi:hypothetical protein
MRLKAYLLLLLLPLAGCAFSAVDRPPLTKYAKMFPRSQTFAVSTEEAIDSSAKALVAMGFEIQSVTSELGVIRTRERAIAVPQVCDCGSWNGVQVHGSGTSIVLVNVAQRAGAVEVAVDFQCGVNFTGHNLYGAPTRQETYQCASPGNVEREFWSTLRRILDAHRTQGGG